ncbi:MULTISPECIES: PP2C family serine/threonine-protein phosphatase [unclassified Pseudomonas]|uniref:PP2C family serine/threonine-protein phosphatase n=1 Tax=unclassified Pseudomonas TaxID=196821 RepID=UPI002AC9DCE7|nr:MULTISPECIES: PP2C family serine/threonine-protein phosphatase [unclassified Pseudomonas]MEB0048411.1 PP2C family serine/threonine-protein phosphatase [Pseudomonas sp. Dout3]MEB0099286.1 PP2C family serine/threonine-protein phosphatase [Pseudomonas sp. DC1.2]WPX57999.1 PP2C family serine/threonine-protein phosphatase [Pseudomonas sp. DC1.2]
MPDIQINFSCKTACAFVAGRSHLTTHTPCQDYVAARQSNEVTCIALADGAGSRARSDVGAQVAVTAALAFVCKNFESLWQNAEKSHAKAAQRLINRCLDAFRRKSKKLGCEINDLSCTLSFVAFSRGRYLAGHLGDGVIARVDIDGQLLALSHPENGEYANTTLFLTDPKVAGRLRMYRGPVEGATGFAIMSDGTAESLYHKSSGIPAPAILKLLEWNTSLPRKKMKSVLADNLQHSIASKTGDDCSIGLLSILKQEGQTHAVSAGEEN